MPSTSPASKHDTAKKWLHRRLWKPASRHLLSDSKLSATRPQTAPQIAVNRELPSPRLALHPPPRPPRPESGVIRDVNAWLDASMDTPPLMGGLPYWRAASAVPSMMTTAEMQYAVPIVPSMTTADMQYAIPIVRPRTPSSQQVKSFCRRAKKMRAKMPALLRTTSQRIVARRQINRRSQSMPQLAIPYETQQLLSLAQSSAHTLIRQARSGDSTRPWTSGHVSREDSMDLSEAPTYSSGRPPPSYRSRTASLLTTSSFGCVDGMSRAQRQVSQQRALQCHGVRGRVKELRRRFQTA